MGIPQNAWFSMENPTKMDGLGIAPFQETLHFSGKTEKQKKGRKFLSFQQSMKTFSSEPRRKSWVSNASRMWGKKKNDSQDGS